MPILRGAFVVALASLGACGDDPPHYIDASTGNGGNVDADTRIHDAPVIDAAPDAMTDGAVGQDATPQDAMVPLDAVPLDAVPLDAVPLDAVPLDAVPLDAVPLDAVPLDAVLLDAAPAPDAIFTDGGVR